MWISGKPKTLTIRFFKATEETDNRGNICQLLGRLTRLFTGRWKNLWNALYFWLTFIFSLKKSACCPESPHFLQLPLSILNDAWRQIEAFMSVDRGWGYSAIPLAWISRKQHFFYIANLVHFLISVRGIHKPAVLYVHSWIHQRDFLNIHRISFIRQNIVLHFYQIQMYTVCGLNIKLVESNLSLYRNNFMFFFIICLNAYCTFAI